VKHVPQYEEEAQMARKSYAKSTYSIRLDGEVVKELQRRAKEEQTTVGALIRRSIDGYLNERDAGEELAQMEGRIITTISRTISQLDRHQLQTRRVADISVAQGEYLRRILALKYVGLGDGEDSAGMLSRTRNGFMGWLPKALSSTGTVRRMIKQVMEPAFIVDEAPPPSENGSEGAEPSAGAAAAASV